MKVFLRHSVMRFTQHEVKGAYEQGKEA
jgi:hypothetical protein